MTHNVHFLAVDLGASSGRVLLGRWNGASFALEELHRFPNNPVQVSGRLHWDILRLWHEIQHGIAAYCRQYDEPLAAIGIDTWAIDFGLLDDAGRLLGNPTHYRDSRTTGMVEDVASIIAPDALFAQTGIQVMPINTLYQLRSMARSDDPQLRAAETLLLIPDLLNYFLTGRKAVEYTNASTTQFLDCRTRGWATDLLAALAIPTRMLPDIVLPGTVLGEVLPDVAALVGLCHSTPVIASASHDTASAVAAVPGLDEHSVYISSGTWSLVGVEINEPITDERARALNVTNEGGVNGTIRLLKNVGGLWLLQESQRRWQRDGHDYGWDDLLVRAAQATPFRSIIDPDAADFLNPGDMPAAIAASCQRSGQPAPSSVGEVVRCCLESLALRYRWVIGALEKLLDHQFTTIRVVGGGSQNRLLCQWTADACGKPVVAGPVEATALGNIVVQAIATGHLSDLAAGRRAVAASVDQETFTPRADAGWDAAFERFVQLVDT